MKDKPCGQCPLKPLADKINYNHLDTKLIKNTIREKTDHERLLIKLLPFNKRDEKLLIINALNMLYFIPN